MYLQIPLPKADMSAPVITCRFFSLGGLVQRLGITGCKDYLQIYGGGDKWNLNVLLTVKLEANIVPELEAWRRWLLAIPGGIEGIDLKM